MTTRRWTIRTTRASASVSESYNTWYDVRILAEGDAVTVWRGLKGGAGARLEPVGAGLRPARVGPAPQPGETVERQTEMYWGYIPEGVYLGLNLDELTAMLEWRGVSEMPELKAPSQDDAEPRMWLPLFFGSPT